jgi:hypothetical protein
LGGNGEIQALKIPAHLACYWLGRSEVEASALHEQEEETIDDKKARLLS